MNILILEDSPHRNKTFRRNLPCATIVDTAEDCIQELQKATEPWDYIFLDHDLGGDMFVESYEKNTGAEVVRWICANTPKIKKVIVHSLNHEAAWRMAADLVDKQYDAKCVPFINLDFDEYEESNTD